MTPLKSNALMSLGHAPTILYFTGLIVFGVIICKFSPTIYNFYKSDPNKSTINGLSENFSSQFDLLSNTFKVNFLI